MVIEKDNFSKMLPDFELKDDYELLELMLQDSKHQPALYQPGPYWASKAKNASCSLKRYGLADFRGTSNFIGASYTDNMPLDIRKKYDNGLKKFAIWLTKNYPLNKIFESQISWTKFYANRSIILMQELLNLKERTKLLLKKYKVPYSLLGNCKYKAQIGDHYYSVHYLDLLEQIDNFASIIKFNEIYSVFEIGGGFGAELHLLLENYKNIRKVLYLDIPPNLYVGTQYLKAFYGTAVCDYRALREVDTIKFSKDDSIEIICIAPWQIERFNDVIGLFLNSHSFVEMPSNIVQNYVDILSRFPEFSKASIALATYDGYDLNTTFHPDKLPEFFKNRKFNYFEMGSLLNSSRRNLFFVSS